MINVSETWKSTYPGAVVGVMALLNLTNPMSSPELGEKKRELEDRLRAQFRQKSDIESSPVIAAYQDYYASFRKTYHVLLQLESVALKGKPIASVAALVEAMFLAELKNGLLTAGHDMDALEEPVTLAAAAGDESYEMLNGRETTLKMGDMMMRDAKGIISSVIYGPDKRTRITPSTKKAMFVVYAPPGIRPDQVASHLDDIHGYCLLFSPSAECDFQETYSA